MRIYECGQNALDEILDGRMELLSYDVACVFDLVAKSNKDVRAAFGQAQRRLTIRLEICCQ